MIDLTRAHALVVAGADGVAFDLGSGSITTADLSDAPARLVTEQVTDAVKEVDEDRVVGSLDRESLWAVTGIQLAGEVVLALEPASIALGDLITRVRAAGYEWRLLSPSAP